MSQRTIDGGFTDDSGGSGRPHDEGDTCGEAVMAAMQAISEHCDTDGVPMEMSDGVVTMVPREEKDRIAGMQPGDMNDSEIDEMIEDSPWLEEWTDALCTRAGLDPGTRQYDECRRNYARDALS